MDKYKEIHLEQPNTLADFLSEEEREEVVSLKITGLIGREDFEDVLDNLCESGGYHDEDDNYIPDYDLAAPLRHLDLGEATYVDGDCLPYFGYVAQQETIILPKGIKTTLDKTESETGFSESEMLRKLVLPEGLKIVGGFNSCENLTDLILPEGLEEICSHAFCGCDAITSIRIPASVKVMDGSCFAGCNIKAYEVDENNAYYTAIDGVVYSKDLKTLVAFPSDYPNKHYEVLKSTQIIGEYAFKFSHIETIELPNGLTNVEYGAFEASDICALDIPESVNQVGEMAFDYCTKLKRFAISKGLKELPRFMLGSCTELKILEIPSNIKVVHYSSFVWSRDLEQIILHDGLEEIADDGFLSTSEGKLRDVYLPKTLKKVPGGVFNYSPYIKEFKLDPDNPYFRVIDGALCSKDGKILFSVPDFNRTNFRVPEGIEEIAEMVFAFMPKLRTIELPSTLRIIKTRAFQSCDSLKQLEIPASLVEIDIDSLWSENLKNIVIKCTVPPKITGNIKDKDWRYEDVNLYVLHDSVQKYREAPGWKSFRIKDIH